MSTVAWLLFAGAVALGVATRLRIAVGPLAILAGALIDALGAPTDTHLVEEGLMLSATFLVFAVGAEVDRRHVERYLPASAAIAFVELALIAAVVVPTASWAGFSLQTGAVLTLALGASSTLLVVEVLRRRERFFEPVGRLSLGVVLVEDLLIVVALALMIGAAQPHGLLGALGGLVVLGLLVTVTRRWLGRLVLVRLRLDEEERLLFVLALLFVFIGIARTAGLPLVTGAFFAGAALSGFPAGAVVRAYLASFSDFFSVVFYVSLGVLVAVPAATALGPALAMAALVMLLRPIAALPLVRRAGLTYRGATEAVTLVGQAGELALIVVLVAGQAGLIDEATIGAVMIVVIVTMTLAPTLSGDRLTLALTHLVPFRAAAPLGAPPTDHVLVIGLGEGGRAMLASMPEDDRRDVVVVDDDPAVLLGLAEQGIRGVRGDGADPDVLAAAGAARARVVVSTMRRMGDNARLLARLPDTPVFVRVAWVEEADEVRRLGGRPVVEADLAEAAFLRWYEDLRS